MRLEPLYRLRFTYPESCGVPLEGGWRQWPFLAEGRAQGSISRRFRGANFPMRRGEAGPFRPDFRAVIETDDGATIFLEWHGYGRAYPVGRRQIVGAIFQTCSRAVLATQRCRVRQRRRGPETRESGGRGGARRRDRRAHLGADRGVTFAA